MLAVRTWLSQQMFQCNVPCWFQAIGCWKEVNLGGPAVRCTSGCQSGTWNFNSPHQSIAGSEHGTWPFISEEYLFSAGACSGKNKTIKDAPIVESSILWTRLLITHLGSWIWKISQIHKRNEEHSCRQKRILKHVQAGCFWRINIEQMERSKRSRPDWWQVGTCRIVTYAPTVAAQQQRYRVLWL